MRLVHLFPGILGEWCTGNNHESSMTWIQLLKHLTKIIGPHDIGIAESIRVNLEPKTWTTDIQASPLCIDRTEEMRDAYFAQLQTLCLSK